MEFKLLFSGRPVVQKGLNDLLCALSTLGSYNWSLTIVGEVPEEATIPEFIFKERLHLLGTVKNEAMPALLNSHDILIVPSHYENFGNIVIEGLACGIAIIASTTGGIKDLIEHRYNGLSFESKNYIELSEQIKFIFDHPCFIKELGENALLTSMRYDWKNIVAETLALLEKFST